jgi:signal transduction histidine kinase
MEGLWTQPRQRAWLFAFGGALVFPIGVVQWLTNTLQPARSAWQLVTGLVLFVACRREWPQRVQAVLVALVCAALPWLMWWERAPWEQLTSAFLLPVTIGLLFVEQLPVAVAAVVFGGVSVEVVLVLLSNAGATEVVGLGFGYLVVVVGAYRVRQVILRERQQEHDHGNALRLSEAGRAQSERLAVVGRLAAGVAHEINNPLAYVKANLGTLEREFKTSELSPTELRELLEETNEGVDRICRIVLDLKMLARDGKEGIEPVDLGEAVQAAVRLATVKLPPGVQVHSELPGALPWVTANGNKLAQVLLNLLINAIDALEEKGGKGAITVRARVEQGAVKVDVLDDGPGFSDAAKAHLFEPFFTTKAPGKGTGLGLALSRQYLESFGGTLQAENRAEGGACFTVTLATAADEDEPARPAA